MSSQTTLVPQSSNTRDLNLNISLPLAVLPENGNSSIYAHIFIYKDDLEGHLGLSAADYHVGRDAEAQVVATKRDQRILEQLGSTRFRDLASARQRASREGNMLYARKSGSTSIFIYFSPDLPSLYLHKFSLSLTC